MSGGLTRLRDWTGAIWPWTMERSGLLQSGTMWIAKPIYESLPYFYLVVGVLCLASSMYVNHWYWPTICFVTGVVCLVAGLVVLLKRRDARSSDRRGS